MISLWALAVTVILASLAFAAGGVLVGAARRGEIEYLRARVVSLEAEIGLGADALRRDLERSTGQIIALADGAAHARLNRNGTAEAVDTPTLGRTYNPAELRDRAEFGEVTFGDGPYPTEGPQTEEEIKAQFEVAQATAPSPEG